MPNKPFNPFKAARVARAGLRGIEREMRRGKRPYFKTISTPFGGIRRHPFKWESISWDKNETSVDMITSSQKGAFEGTTGRWDSYASFIKYITPRVAEDVTYRLEILDEKHKKIKAKRRGSLPVNEKRAAAMLYGLGLYSEHQRTGNRKWMRGVLRAVAEGKMTAEDAFSSTHAGFIQTSKGGMGKVRKFFERTANRKAAGRGGFNPKIVEIGIDAMSSDSELEANYGPITRSGKKYQLALASGASKANDPQTESEAIDAIETYHEALSLPTHRKKRAKFKK